MPKCLSNDAFKIVYMYVVNRIIGGGGGGAGIP